MKFIKSVVLIFVLFLCTSLLYSCGSKEVAGPQGPQGEPGRDGTSLLTGNGIPSSNLGKNGDSYIDLDSWNYYIKTNNEWVNNGSIKEGDEKDNSNEYVGTDGLEFYPINESECAVSIGNARLLSEIVIPSKYKNFTVTTLISDDTINGEYSTLVKYPNLTQIQLPNSLTNIESFALSGCKSLTKIVIPNGVVSIGSSAFYGCSSLESITLPFIGNTLDGTTNTHFGYIFGAKSYSNNDVYVPTSLKEVIITGGSSIGKSAFEGCDSLTSIVIPNSVTSIGNSAFYYCPSLTSIVIPNSVTSIGNSAFYYCRSLTSIVIPNSVISIGNSAFYYCHSLTSIVIPNSVTSIGDYAFVDCYSLTIYCESTSKPSGWDSNWNSSKWNSYNRPVYFGVNENNFAEIDNLQYILDLENNTAIVSGYTGIEETAEILSTITHNNIEYNVISIGDYAFSTCDSLTSIVIPNSVTNIGDYAFAGCGSLTIYCESTSEPFGWDSKWNSSNRPVYFGVNENNFVEVDNLQYILDLENNTAIVSRYTGIEETVEILSTITHNNIEYSVTSIGNSAFSYCDSLTSIVIPNSVTSIGDSAFSSCYSLTSIVIPNSVTSIGHYAFKYCDSLTSIVIPNSVTSIGEEAFYSCNNLTIYCETSLQPSGWNTYWTESDRPIYWAGQWEYDGNGKPIPLI